MREKSRDMSTMSSHIFLFVLLLLRGCSIIWRRLKIAFAIVHAKVGVGIHIRLGIKRDEIHDEMRIFSKVTASESIISAAVSTKSASIH